MKILGSRMELTWAKVLGSLLMFNLGCNGVKRTTCKRYHSRRLRFDGLTVYQETDYPVLIVAPI